MCVYCEDNQLYTQFQDLYVKYFSNNKHLKLYKSNLKVEDILDNDHALSIIKEEHLRNNHRGINEVYSELKTKYFFPELIKLITKFINNCETCRLAKFDRHPIKIPYQISETAAKLNEIVHIDIWFPLRNTMYLTTIDKFTKYATIHKLEDRTWISILKAIKERIRFLGKMKKLIFDNDRCLLHNAVELFLKENEIETHVTTAGIKTGNSDIERLHGILNEHLRIIATDKEENSAELDEKIHKAITCYNNTIHSTTKMKPIDFIEKNLSKDEINEIKEKFEKEKTERINKLNSNRNNHYNLHEDVVVNRKIAKNTPKYKRLNNYRKDNNYVIDTDNNRKIKYYQTQLKRKYRYEN